MAEKANKKWVELGDPMDVEDVADVEEFRIVDCADSLLVRSCDNFIRRTGMPLDEELLSKWRQREHASSLNVTSSVR